MSTMGLSALHLKRLQRILMGATMSAIVIVALLAIYNRRHAIASSGLVSRVRFQPIRAVRKLRSA